MTLGTSGFRMTPRSPTALTLSLGIMMVIPLSTILRMKEALFLTHDLLGFDAFDHTHTMTWINCLVTDLEHRIKTPFLMIPHE